MPDSFQLKPFQREALGALEGPAHVICVAPTGSGKSHIYETLAARSGERVLLVTPLVALARQQAARLRATGVEVSMGAGDPTSRPPRSGAWIVSPEKLYNGFSDRALSELRSWQPSLLVVDECHCLWEWGRGFRRAFAPLPSLIRSHSISRSLWLTATLCPEARSSLHASLPPPLREVGAFDLPAGLELRCIRVPWPERTGALLAHCRASHSAGIVFVQTRAAADRYARLIAEAVGPTIAYHAGLSSEERRSAEALFAQEKIRIIVATSAFGMGMDFSHPRWVVLLQAPPTLLALTQAIGRVGRAGGRGRAIVFWDAEDFRLIEWAAEAPELSRTLGFLASEGCRREALRAYFDPERAGVGDAIGCGVCDGCGADAGSRS